MGNALVILKSDADRAKVAIWATKAPRGTRVAFQYSKRSIPQNAKLWACLTEISEQVEWYGQNLSPDDWKDILTAALKKARVVPNIDGNGFVALGLRSSQMTKEEFSNLLELALAFGAQHGVRFSDDEERAA